MELQTIREKLRSLQADPPTAEAVSLPWSQQAGIDGYEGDRSRQEIAIEALKQRSHGAESAQAYNDSLIAQALYRLEVQASIINEQSQKQAETLLALRRSAQQASLGLQRQGIESHPQLSVITQFLERYSSAVVPHLEKDNQGHFTLSYISVDFQCAERDAIDAARTLRSRGRAASLQEQLFSEPIPSVLATHLSQDRPEERLAEGWAMSEPTQTHRLKTCTAKNIKKNRKNRLQKSLGNIIDQVLYLLNPKRKRVHANAEAMLSDRDSSGSREEGFMDAANASSLPADPFFDQFSWLDGTIWFSGAAIAKIVVQMIAFYYPTVQTLFVTAIAITITFTLYQVIISRSDDYSLVYRLCIAMAGLMLASIFR